MCKKRCTVREWCTQSVCRPLVQPPTYKGAEGVKKRRGVPWLQSSCVYIMWAEPLNREQTPFLFPFSHKLQ